jgi:hypothetical protein
MSNVLILECINWYGIFYLVMPLIKTELVFFRHCLAQARALKKCVF